MTVQASTPAPGAGAEPRVPLVDLRDIRVSFGGVHAVDGVSVNSIPASCRSGWRQWRRQVDASGPSPALIPRTRARSSSTARRPRSRTRDAKTYGIETIYQTLALADNVDAAANLFLGRELKTQIGSLDDGAMESATRKVMGRLNPKFRNFKVPVKSLSGGQRQSVAIARAVHFNAKILIMDEPTAALGPAETAQVRARSAAQERGDRDLPDQPRHPRRLRPGRPDQRHAPGQAGRNGRQGQGDQGRGPGDDHHRQEARAGIGAGDGRAHQLTGLVPGRSARVGGRGGPADLGCSGGSSRRRRASRSRRASCGSPRAS